MTSSRRAPPSQPPRVRATAGLGRRDLLAAAGLAFVHGVHAAEPTPDRAAQTLDRWRALAASAPTAALDPARAAEREALLASGERHLATGDAEAALRDFDLAAQRAHAADTEMSLVRAWMQQGEYRRALAFVAHTAQAHRQVVGGAVLYGWLLSRGAQDAAALRMLDGAAEIEAGSPLVERTRALVGASAAVPEGALLAPPLRLAPYATGPSPPRAAHVVATGVLLPDGRHALTSAAALRGVRGLWLRNGLGQTVKARPAGAQAAHEGLVALELASALPADVQPAAARDPFPGSPGCVLVHRADAQGGAAWPRLYAGFHGMPDEREPDRRRLGIDVPEPATGPRSLQGGPIFDGAGRWAGIALPHADGAPRAVMRSVLAARWPQLIGTSVPEAAAGPAPRAAFDEIYERALRTSLQVIVAA